MTTQFEHDKLRTLENKRKLVTNSNLLYWYEKLYQFMFSEVEDIGEKKILEIGSGMSPAKLFIPNIITSDILELDYLDHCFDCHKISQYDGIADGSLDIIAFTNVLHHLKNPLVFLEQSRVKLAPGGTIILVEPYLSTLSNFIYRYIHHEHLDTDITDPILEIIDGPLASANIAIPHMIFFSGNDWEQTLRHYYTFNTSDIRFFTGLSYIATGGVSHALPIPASFYKTFFRLDQYLASHLPSLYSSFFVLRLVKT